MRSASVMLIVMAASLVGCGERPADSAAETTSAELAADAQAKITARKEADAAREAERLKDLWVYTDVPVGKGRQLAAQIRSTNDVDTDGQGGRSVLLVFRDHPDWGRSSYLVLTAGDFRCSPKCAVSVRTDDTEPGSMTAHRPKTDQAIAMFIDDWRALWRVTADATRLSIEFPVEAGGTRTATYDVAGLDTSKMPGWDRLARR